MRLPPAEHLSQLIHSPVDYLKLYMECEQEGVLPDLLKALEALPFSEIREARRARILYRLGQYQAMRGLLESHLAEPLCLAWYVVELVRQGGEEQLRKVITRFSVTWPINAKPTNLEAKARLHVARGVAFVTLNMMDSAEREFSEAVRLSELLGDQLTRSVAIMEFARRDLFNNKLEQARSTYREILERVPANTAIADFSMSYMTLLHWMLGMGENGLSPWAKHALRLASLQTWDEPIPDYPADVNLKIMGESLLLLKDLRVRCDRYLFHAPWHSPQRSQLVELPQILELHQPSTGNEIVRFFTQMSAALALALAGDPQAISVLDHALQKPITGILQLVVAHQAARLEVAMLLGPTDKLALQQTAADLLEQLQLLSPAGLRWVIWWMRHFSPHALCILAEHTELLQAGADTCLQIGPQQVKFNQQIVSGYPLHLLDQQKQGSGQDTVALMESHQKLLHRLGKPPVVFLDRIASLHLKDKDSSKGNPCEITETLSKMES
ncbi:hypothetical protein [Deinococcus cellulosilyticus]|uniref:Tetratricopeptide repeat protein n=1 Tax=Deinococcus cellulosilyticus (strain DSM 18568 / NBRC 106333 / KACC 11606 / 5516J-15) TaxID=1223518 RepID=A0A511N4D9_DEIC1|nr:hypothetical protein [Deinococcus cellulosilyticus]GEM47296.1 hypothetical protein DC3_29310 [Deinococcus cellulosilyticus NBRC 106333 = KACC 11606]